MSSFQLVGIVTVLMALVIVGNALFRRRLQSGQMLKLAAIWVVIIGVAWALVAAFRAA